MSRIFQARESVLDLVSTSVNTMTIPLVAWRMCVAPRVLCNALFNHNHSFRHAPRQTARANEPTHDSQANGGSDWFRAFVPNDDLIDPLATELFR